jgi:class 3 adenylate cyclase
MYYKVFLNKILQALDLLAGAVTFQIPHRPTEKLQIRIGLHTGPVVAGVVGELK